MKDYGSIIAGYSDFSDYKTLKERCEYYLQNKINTHNVIIVYSHESGTDSLCERFAAEYNLQCGVYPAEWNKCERVAIFIRDNQMAVAADALIAFGDGKSSGTKSMIDIAKSKRLRVAVVRIYKSE